MPTQRGYVSARKTVFRLFAVVSAFLFLAATFIFCISLLVPSPREAVSANAAYESYHYYQLPEHQKKIALSFDDGPDPEATKKIVDTLSAAGVPATFFLIGQHVLAYPDLARYVVDKGFTIGNHTFTHSSRVHDSPQRLAAELAATDRIIERATGVRTRYYRPPYLLTIGIDPAPNPWVSEEPANLWALQMGYVPVGIDIDSHDWNATTAEGIIERFEQEITDNRHIALFHDVPHTAEALPQILSWLKAEGYQIVPLEELLVPTAGVPPLSEYSIFAPVETAYLHFLSHAGVGLGAIGALLLGLLLLRIFVLMSLLARKNHEAPPPPLGRYPLISVLIPAYNEEENIEATVQSVLQSDYPRREIIVIDDGSIDSTADRVRALCKKYPKVVRLLEIENGGKARALTIATEDARGEILVVLDADAVLESSALHAFARHFVDPRVGAVAGKVYTTGTNGLLGKFQALEYCVGQNIEKRAFSALGLVGVVPGPAGAWRTSAVRDAGGFPTDTLVEDQDMTLTLLREGWRINYEPTAIAYTETPATLSAFLAQRFRWVYGGIECFWKHASVIVEQPRTALAFLLMPHNFIFGIVLPVMYPLIDLVLIASVFMGFWSEALIPVLIFTIVDMLYVAWALNGEPRHLQRLVFVVPLLRIVYRQLLYYTVLRGLVRAIEGTGSAWNKVARLGETRRFFEERLAKEHLAISK